MRNISFTITTPQFIARTKTVTRRADWLFLKAGEVLCAVEKSQGLGKGGKVKRLGTIRVLSVRREPLCRLLDSDAYGKAEMALEGFPDMPAAEFISMLCRKHQGLKPENPITRIEFEYLDQVERAA